MLIVMNAGEESRSLDLATMPIKDAAECERLTGWSWVEWREALASDKSAAVGFAWWLAGRRAGVEQGKFSDLDLDLAKLRWSVELSDEEKKRAMEIVADVCAALMTEPPSRPNRNAPDEILRLFAQNRKD